MNDETTIAAERLLSVHVHDSIDPRCGHDGCHYDSPPQPREQAIALVRVALNRPAGPLPRSGSWTRPIAFGQRTVTLSPAEPRDPA